MLLFSSGVTDGWLWWVREELVEEDCGEGRIKFIIGQEDKRDTFIDR